MAARTIPIHLVVVKRCPGSTGETRWMRTWVPRLLRGISWRGKLELVLVGNREIRALKKKFSRVDRVTDVLAFGAPGAELPATVVVSVQRARQEARARGKRYRDELALYVVHGILHLAGYRDDTPRAFREMHRREDDLLLALGMAPGGVAR